MSIQQISDARWNQYAWALSGLSCENGEFVLISAFDRDEITLNLAEAKRLKRQLNRHLRACAAQAQQKANK